MSGPHGYRRHIPQGNSPDEMRVLATRIWDAIDSVRKESQSSSAAIAQQQILASQSPTSPAPLPPPPLSTDGTFHDIFLLMGG